MSTLWLITDKGDLDARALVDGEVFGLRGRAHYSRQSPGARLFTRNGQNLVFMTPDHRAVWVTFRPTPGKAERADGLEGWECALFRNEGAWKMQRVKSRDLIREAVELSYSIWGRPGKDGIFTFIKPECVGKGREDHIAGYCYRRAGWKRVGAASDGKPRFRAPTPAVIRPFWTWTFKGDRGGVVRQELEGFAEALFA